eukprot:Nk52_evm14s2473 gene=Nk52_evmTU14s2473
MDSDMEVDNEGSQDHGGDNGPLVASLVRYCLFCEANKKIIRRADLLDVLGDRRKSATSLIKKAEESLRKVFGYELVMLPAADLPQAPKKRGAAAKAKTVVTNNYVLVNNLEINHKIRELVYEENAEAYGLKMLILALVCISSPMAESKLERHLIGFNVDISKTARSTHKVFGSAHSLITGLVNSGYLTKQRLTDQQNSPQYQFVLGPRALKEISKKEIINFIAKVDGCDPVTLYQQFNLNADGTENQENENQPNRREVEA